MITETFLNLIFGLVNTLLSLVPSLDLSFLSSVAGAWNDFLLVINPILFFFPVNVLSYCIHFIIQFHILTFIWYYMNWTIRKIPGVK